MKKKLAVGLIVSTMAIGAFTVYADSSNTNEFPSQRGHNNMEIEHSNIMEVEHNNMMERSNEPKEMRHEAQVEINNEVPEKSTITEKQSNDHRQHFNEMNKFHEENGFKGDDCNGNRTGRRQGHGMMNRRN